MTNGTTKGLIKIRSEKFQTIGSFSRITFQTNDDFCLSFYLNRNLMTKRIDYILAKIKSTSNFLEKEIWVIPLKDLPPRKKFVIKLLRIFMLAFRKFNEDELFIRASALTYYTLLAIVPFVAMGFGIAKGFGLEQFLEKQLREVFVGREEVFNWIMEFANSMLQTTQGGIVAGVGLVILLYTIIIVLVYVEETFNGIWQIKQSRRLSRKLSDYFALMLIAPLFLILSSAATVYLTTQVTNLTGSYNMLEFLSPAIIFFVNLAPYVLIWIVFMLLYIVMPNTNVNLLSALIGAVIAGSVFILVQWTYINFQVGVSRYNAIYGSFAALPLLLLWMRISWLIVLFGAEISYATQNVALYEFEHESKNISPYNKKILSLYIYNLLSKRFAMGESPLTAQQISTELEIPITIVREIMDDLIETKLLNHTSSEHSVEKAYQPASDIHKIDVRILMEKLDHNGMDILIAKESTELEEIIRTIKSFRQTLESSPDNRLVKDI
jgi:membrane protein